MRTPGAAWLDPEPACASCGRSATATRTGQCIYCLKPLAEHASSIEPSETLGFPEDSGVLMEKAPAIFLLDDCTNVHYLPNSTWKTKMLESLNDPVDVLTAFLEGRIQPLRFRWQGRVVRVHRVTGEWSRREGQSLLKFFAVEGPGAESYELCYDPRGPRWVLRRAWVGPGAS